MTACLLEQTAARPVDSFPLSAGGAQIYKHAADIHPAIWNAAFGDSHKDFEYYQLIEQTMLAGFSYLYLLLFDEQCDPVALQPLIIVEQDLLATAGSAITAVINFGRKLWPRLLRTRMLLAGCLVGDSKPGVIAPANPRRIHGLLAQALHVFARRQKISLVSTKDFPAALRDELLPFVKAGWRLRTSVAPRAVHPRTASSSTAQAHAQHLRGEMQSIVEYGAGRRSSREN